MDRRDSSCEEPASPQPPLSFRLKGALEQAPRLSDFRHRDEPTRHESSQQHPDAIRKLSLLLRRYAHWDTGPRNPASVAFSCFCIQWWRSLSCRPQPRRVLSKSSRAMRCFLTERMRSRSSGFPARRSRAVPIIIVTLYLYIKNIYNVATIYI